MLDKINFRELKYILPLIFLPGLILIGYVIFPTSLDENANKDTLRSSDQLITDIQDAEKQVEGTKFESLRQVYKGLFDTTTVTSPVENKDTVEKNPIQEGSEYAKEPMQPYYTDWEQYDDEEDDYTKPPMAKMKKGEEMELFKRQIRLLDSLEHPENYVKVISEYQKNRNIASEYPPNDYVNNLVVEEKKTDLLKMEKDENGTSSYFNTIKSSQGNMPIKAMLDEFIKAGEGSRVKIRLLDDVSIGNVKLSKGFYLYGQVTGFSAERVKINITSILANNELLKVNIAIYDNDGQEGFYVPKSAFREASKQAGGQIASQGVSLNNNAANSGFNAQSMATQFGWQALQNLYNSSSQAFAKSIRKNRALLKYASFVYLINQDEEQN